MFSPLLTAFVFSLVQPAAMESMASGTFDVSVSPNAAVTGPVGLLGIAKTYHGGLEGTGTGQMLGAGNPEGGTASYVALEQVTATLAGRQGGFILLHNGAMHAGSQEMMVRIAPGSGTFGLQEISGTMDIRIEGDVHRYVLHYRLPR